MNKLGHKEPITENSGQREPIPNKLTYPIQTRPITSMNKLEHKEPITNNPGKSEFSLNQFKQIIRTNENMVTFFDGKKNYSSTFFCYY